MKVFQIQEQCCASREMPGLRVKGGTKNTVWEYLGLERGDEKPVDDGKVMCRTCHQHVVDI